MYHYRNFVTLAIIWTISESVAYMGNKRMCANIIILLYSAIVGNIVKSMPLLDNIKICAHIGILFIFCHIGHFGVWSLSEEQMFIPL